MEKITMLVLMQRQLKCQKTGLFMTVLCEPMVSIVLT